MQVTVTGGVGHGAAVLQYSANDIAERTAVALANTIDTTYGRAIYYNPAHPPVTPSAGYLIVTTNVAAHVINAQGFGAVVDENTGVGSTVKGGGNAAGQIVLASNGGLTFSATSGATTVVAGGSANRITFAGDTGTSAAYTSTGNDTITGGDGQTTISAGAGNNRIILGSGPSMVLVSGTDAISLGAGKDTVAVTNLGAALVLGASSVAGSGYSLTFIGGTGTNANTVLGGAGSYNVHAGAGGGKFTGGSGGNNLIVGSTGAVTIAGGGAGDTLRGGTASDLVKAALGNETLFGGAGNNTFDLQVHAVASQGGLTTVDMIGDFNTHDKLNVGGTLAINYAINTYQMTSSGGYFFLEDGTKVVLQGFHTKITASDFKH